MDGDWDLFSWPHEPPFLQLNTAHLEVIHAVPPNHDPAPGKIHSKITAFTRKTVLQERFSQPGGAGISPPSFWGSTPTSAAQNHTGVGVTTPCYGIVMLQSHVALFLFKGSECLEPKDRTEYSDSVTFQQADFCPWSHPVRPSQLPEDPF